MSKLWRRILLGLGILALGGACNPLMLPFYLTSPESKFPAEYKKLASDDKKKEVRVAILTYMGVEPNPELLHADRDITRLLTKQLQDLCKHNQEKVVVVNPFKIEEYKNSHPDWNRTHVELTEIGKDLHVDFVIYLEVERLSLYQPDSNMMFFRGQANLDVKLVDVNNPDESPEKRVFTFTYPSEGRGGNVVVDSDTPPQLFREKFLKALTKQLSWYFTAHPTIDSRWVD